MSGCLLISVSSLTRMSEQQTNLLLVGEVEKYPILYNYHLPGYSKKNETEKAWVEVGDVVKLTAAECKERWKNIRTVFVRHMKRSRIGSGTKEKKAYYLADALQFTVPYIKALGKTSGNLSQPQLEEEDGPRRRRMIEPIKKHISKKKRAAEIDDVDIEYLDRKNATSLANDEQVPSEPRQEALKMFLLSMLPDLMQMDDQEVRQFKRKTLDVVDEILSAKSARPPSSCPSTSNYSFSIKASPPTIN